MRISQMRLLILFLKVPAQEKPKKKTGRARRREQYSKRFAKKVASPNGMRTGPNSNYQPPTSS